MASVTSTYARAFVDVVLDKRLDATKILQELHALGALLAEHRDLRRIWENPSIPAQQKRNLLGAIVAHEGISRPVRNLLAVLMDHRRDQFFERIVDSFQH